jgi:hypothetical protein
MKQRPLMLSGLLLGLMLAAGPSLAAEEQIFGSQLMTPQERMEYQNKMRAAKTQAERDKLRQEHHDAMQARAKAQGKTLPAEPPARGGGMGPGAGMGPGGGGMGPGRRGN